MSYLGFCHSGLEAKGCSAGNAEAQSGIAAERVGSHLTTFVERSWAEAFQR
jgi:hypothetical protein